MKQIIQNSHINLEWILEGLFYLELDLIFINIFEINK